MIFIDSWACLEVSLGGTDAPQALSVLEKAETKGAIVSTTVLTEVYYVLDREKETTAAEKAMEMITGFENLDVLPVTPSYADMIHLATAEQLSECDVLYTGDSDFESVTEMECRVY